VNRTPQASTPITGTRKMAITTRIKNGKINLSMVFGFNCQYFGELCKQLR
jgi:hypothetical protein